MTIKKLNLHLVSDSSGETVISVAKSALKHFRSIETIEYVWSFVKKEEQIDKILEEINRKSDEHNFVICTITDDELRKYLKDNCIKLKIPYRTILSHIIREISSYLEIEKDEKLDLHTEINNEYFQRIEAINYTINHDDGQNIQDIDKADIILVGVSRTSKSPTSKRGLLTLIDLKKEIEYNKLLLKDVSSEKEKLDNKVFGLYEKSLDLDLLDEQAKNALGYVNPNELMVVLDVE
ncbi:putative pyruvate, phosphate dikinase regulatory protein [Euwallacea similis]|uniref:putative pyruvate, phosphate dikinase regulatory protein n=1 Tax=Euwallacea similis TaxID=1736056 RepID=UPI00344C2CA3